MQTRWITDILIHQTDWMGFDLLDEFGQGIHVASARLNRPLGHSILVKGLMDGTLIRDASPRPGPIGFLHHRIQQVNRGFPGHDTPENKPAFPKISRRDFYPELLQRKADPSKISQRTTSLCGPASLMYLTATHWPDRYFDFASTLFETGSATLGSLYVAPGADCRNCNPYGSIATADWVALASIRDSENSLWDYDDVDDEIGGITLPSTLARWLGSVGFRDLCNETNLYFTKGESNLREAADLHRKGYEVCLLINANAIQASPSQGSPGGIFTTANHWVVLTSEMVFSGDELSFKIFTWGEGSRNVPKGASKMPIQWWLDGYYGYVACKA